MTMFSTSKRILQNRKLFEAISYKIQGVSYLHSCIIRQTLNGKRIINLSANHRYSVINLKSIYGTRLISTNVNEILNSADTATIEPSETIYNASASATVNTSSQTTQSSATVNSPLDQTVQPDIAPVSEFPIPDPPTPPVKVTETVDVITYTGIDPPFEYLGLGGWSPVGLVQNGFECLHSTVGLPWWGSIIAATVIARAALFPFLVLSQRNSAKMSNNLPTFQELQTKIGEAKQRGETMEAARYTQDLMLFMKEKGISPLKNVIMPLVQAPVFISFFMGLREMANLPVKSMHNEGLFWFTDLTVPDQYYILPVLTSFTMWITIELGTEAGRISTANASLVKNILRFMPVVILPFSINFPGAILIYWLTTNSISLALTGLFKSNAVRSILKIERRVIHPEKKSDTKKIGFIKGIKKWWKDTRTQGANEDRYRKSIISFTSAGRGAVPKTYKYNPTVARTVQSSTMTSIQAKKSS